MRLKHSHLQLLLENASKNSVYFQNIFVPLGQPLKICSFPAPDPPFHLDGSVGRGIFFFSKFIHKSGSFKVEQRIMFI